MQYAIAPSTRLPSVTIAREADLNRASIAEAATRLRSWALIRGERITGLPFLRLHGNLSCSVHVPVDGRIPPHNETGISPARTPEGLTVTVRVVRFDEIRAVVRALSSEIGLDCGRAGPVEFHPTDAEFRHGTLVWPVHRHPAALAATVALPGQGVRAAELAS
ncbi:MAG: hypothetical protein AMXMBFR80_02370 [Dehalococcoidia bacterium]